MSATDFHFSLKGNVNSLHAGLNKRKEFYLTVQNLTENYIPQVKVKLAGPPEVKLLVKLEFYGGIAKRNSKSRLFTVLVKENGIFTLTATLTTKRGHSIELPIMLQVGLVQEANKPISLVSTHKTEKTGIQVNCPYCGDKIDEDATFCPHCGSNLADYKKESVEAQEEKKSKHCQNCGNELPIEAKFCAKCGQKVD
ncbi:MAG: zinc-ribbon domain-containing protein [Candidatus Lokiarchaeota archaeon]|nr:zinc-ribbon domain-containing protein [Candidatus Lokiarchaeota archaeon]